MSTLALSAQDRQVAFQDDFNMLVSSSNFAGFEPDPDTLLSVRPAMAELMPLAQLEASSKTELFQGYSACMDSLESMRTDLKRLLVNVVRTNTTWFDDGKAKTRRLSEQQLKSNFDSAAFAISADFGGEARAEVAALPMPKLKKRLLAGVVDGTTNLLRRANLEMMKLVSSEQLGWIQWHADDVCRYTFHRNEVSDSTTGKTSTTKRTASQETKTTTKSRVRKFRHSTIMHDVVDAKDNPLPALGVAKPKPVEKLINETPSWLQGMMSIVTGFQIAEERRDREAIVDRWDESSEEIRELPPVRVERTNFDPALVLGPYVLVGWDENNKL